jgi:ARG/rhodanese/phosphatase superfamily protein
MEIVRKALKDARLGEPRAHANLAVFPLWAPASVDRPYMTLEEGLSSGRVRVTEVSREGSVPELCLVNEADRPVLLLDGEELRGAKQNRVLNLTILAPAGKTIVVPVSCVEQGRWAHRSEAFSSSNHVLYARSRAANAAVVTDSLGSMGRAVSDQGAVWDSIDEKMHRLGTSSATRAMEDIYLARSGKIDEFVASLRPEPEQTGVVFALNAKVAGLELFDHPDAFASSFPKLVRSWALDAIEDSPDEGAVPSADAARAFLEMVAEAEMQSFAAVGQGTDVRLSAAQVTGGAVVDGGRVMHLIAFRREDEQRNRINLGEFRAEEDKTPSESWIARVRRRVSGR